MTLAWEQVIIDSADPEAPFSFACRKAKTIKNRFDRFHDPAVTLSVTADA